MKRGMKNFVLLKIHLASGKKTLMWKHTKEEVMRERERERERASNDEERKVFWVAGMWKNIVRVLGKNDNKDTLTFTI